MNIYVSNLSFNVTDDDLRGFFEEYGNVNSAKVVMDKYTQRSRGFGFVEMDSKEEADKLFNGLSAGGKVGMPLTDMFWGSYWGQLTDKFGIGWMVNYTPPRG